MPSKGTLEELGEGSATQHQEDCDCYSLEELLAHGHSTPEDFGGWVEAPSPADSRDQRDESLPPELFDLGPGSSSQVHDRLVQLRVRRSAWESVSEETKETVSETIDLIMWLEKNIQNLLDGAVSPKRYAEAMLPRYLALRREETERFRMFLLETQREPSLRVARTLLEELKEVLKSVKNEGERGHRGRFADANWLAMKADAVNAVVAPHLIEDEPAPCTPEIIRQLKTESPDTIARLLVRQVFQDVSADALRRPRLRRRPSK
jgi:hypothetical protein